jgi:uncharacterized membrane protein required for colicin V production
MTLPSIVFPYIDLALIIIAVLAVIDGYMHGFMLMVLNVLSVVAALFLAWILSPAIASVLPLYPRSGTGFSGSVGDLIYTKLNTGLWFIILFIIVMLLSILLRPLVKLIGKIPVIKITNKILGAAFGLLLAAFWLLVLTFILSTPLFTNGKEAIEASWLKPFSETSQQVLGTVSSRLSDNVLVQRIVSGQPLTQQELDDINAWLVKNNIDQKSIDAFLQQIR